MKLRSTIQRPNAKITGPAGEDVSKAGATIVAGSGASSCWADAQSAGETP